MQAGRSNRQPGNMYLNLAFSWLGAPPSCFSWVPLGFHLVPLWFLLCSPGFPLASPGPSDSPCFLLGSFWLPLAFWALPGTPGFLLGSFWLPLAFCIHIRFRYNCRVWIHTQGQCRNCLTLASFGFPLQELHVLVSLQRDSRPLGSCSGM
jgi:hypothetical protein